MVALGETVYSCGIDDALRAISHTSRAYSGVEVRLGSQPHGLSVGDDGTIIIACVNQVGLCARLHMTRPIFAQIGINQRMSTSGGSCERWNEGELPASEL